MLWNIIGFRDKVDIGIIWGCYGNIIGFRDKVDIGIILGYCRV